MIMVSKNISFDDYIASLSQERQDRIAKLTAELREQNTLAQLREIMQYTQQQMADSLGIPLSDIVEMEKKPYDPSLSIVKRYAKATNCEVVLRLTNVDGEKIIFDI